jgi:alpha-D-ribose 1-methylphosphonate 5-phosphate C-P lyase
LTLFGAGREKKIYAIPPFTEVLPIAFNDYPFEAEDMQGKSCELCGSTTSYLEESTDETTGRKHVQCSDTAYCRKRRYTMRGDKP